MKIHNKLSLLAILSLLLVIVFAGTYAYSRYVSVAKVTGDVDVAVWSILVNGCNIVNPGENPDEIYDQCFQRVPSEENPEELVLVKNFRVTDESISYFPLENDELVETRKIAPGTEARFSVIIDPGLTEAAFRYDLTAWYEGENDFIKLYAIELDENGESKKDENGNEITYSLNDSKYSNTIFFSEDSEISRIHRLQIKVVWENDETGATDETDTEIGTKLGENGESPILEIPVRIDFQQITSEAELEDIMNGNDSNNTSNDTSENISE